MNRILTFFALAFSSVALLTSISAITSEPVPPTATPTDAPIPSELPDLLDLQDELADHREALRLLAYDQLYQLLDTYMQIPYVPTDCGGVWRYLGSTYQALELSSTDARPSSAFWVSNSPFFLDQKRFDFTRTCLEENVW